MPFVSGALILAAGSFAWACTGASGTTNIVSPAAGISGFPAGGPGTSIVANVAGGMLPSTSYDMRFQDPSTRVTAGNEEAVLPCHHGTVISVSSVTSSSAGAIGNTTGTVPGSALPGRAAVCFADTGGTGSNSAPATFIVT